MIMSYLSKIEIMSKKELKNLNVVQKVIDKRIKQKEAAEIFTLSARAAGIPFINVLHSTSVTEYYEAGLQSWPDRRNYPWVRKLFSEEKLKNLMNL